MQNTTPPINIDNLKNQVPTPPKPELPKDYVNYQVALEQLLQLKESGTIDLKLYDYLFSRLKTPWIVGMDNNELMDLENVHRVELSPEEIKQAEEANRKLMMSSYKIKFCINSLSTDPFVQCLLGHVESYPYPVDFTNGNQKVEVKRIDWASRPAMYNEAPELYAKSEFTDTVEVNFIQKNQNGEIEAEIVENPKSKK
jgi:hypothetical protein